MTVLLPLLSSLIVFIDVLTVRVSPSLANSEIQVEFTNAYASHGIIERCYIADAVGRIHEDFTSRVVNDQRGVQSIELRINSLATGKYFVVISCQNETITESFVVRR